MKKLPYIQSLALLCLLAAACTKKTFEAVKQPAALIKLNAGEKINLIQEPLKEGMVTWENTAAHLDVEGLLRIVAGKQSYFFWQIKCPATLKCNGEKVYLPVVSTLAYDVAKVPFAKEQPQPQNIQAFLVDSERIQTALVTAKFIADFKSPMPEKMIEPLFDAYLQKLNPRSKEAADLLVRLYLLATLANAKDRGNALPAGFAQMPDGMVKSIQNLVAKSAEGETVTPFMNGLKNYTARKYNEFLEEETKTFPLNGKTYKALAQNYKTLNKFPGLREKILIKIFSERVFSYHSGDAKGPNKAAPDFAKALNIGVDSWLLEQKVPTDCFAFRLPTHDYEFCAQIVQAESDKKGLRFLLSLAPKTEKTKRALGDALASASEATTTKPEDEPKPEAAGQGDGPVVTGTLAPGFYIWLIPDETTVYIEGIKKFEKDAADMKKQITDASFDTGISHRSLLEFAIKYGEGGYDASAGEYRYSVELKAGKPYNNFLKMAKAEVGGGSNEYSGDLPDSFTKNMAPGMEGDSEYKVRWFQSAKGGSYEFGLTGAIINVYRGNTHSEKVSESCFYNGSEVQVSFKADNLSTGLPDKVEVKFPTDGGLCNMILNPKD